MTMSVFNFRIDDDLDDAITATVEREGLRKSMWAREVLGAVALGGVTLDQLRELVEANGRRDQKPHPARFSVQPIQPRQETGLGRCRHPKTAIKNLVFTDVCTVCDQVVRQR